MLLWYCAGTVFAIWNVFQSNGLDTRLLALGGLMPLLVDLPFGAQRFGHSLLAPVGALVVVMLITIGRGSRLRRRRIIGLPIGWMCGTALSGAFANQNVFWWPAFGVSVPRVHLLPPLGIAVALESVGAMLAWWCVIRFGLRDAARRQDFLRTGRVVIASKPPDLRATDNKGSKLR